MKKYIRSAELSPEELEADEAAYQEHLKNATSNPAFQELKNVVEGMGYKITVAYLEGSRNNISCTINPADRLHPEIYIGSKNKVHNARVGDVAVRIQTTAFGFLTLEEYGPYIDSCNDAKELAEFLEAWPRWGELYKYEDEE